MRPKITASGCRVARPARSMFHRVAALRRAVQIPRRSDRLRPIRRRLWAPPYRPAATRCGLARRVGLGHRHIRRVEPFRHQRRLRRSGGFHAGGRLGLAGIVRNSGSAAPTTTASARFLSLRRRCSQRYAGCGRFHLHRSLGRRFVALRSASASEHIGVGLFVAAELKQAARLRLFQQVAKGAKTVGGLAEAGLASLDGVLEYRGPDLAAVATLGHQRVEGLHRHLDRLTAPHVQVFATAAVLVRAAPGRGLGVARLTSHLHPLALAHQIVVKDELVAVGDQQIGGRLLDANADHLLGVLAQLGHQGREVRVAADDDEGVDVRLGVAQIERVDHQPDVGRVLARLAHVRYLDQLEIGFVHGGFEALVTLPVAVGLLDDDAALEQQAFEDRLDIELLEVRVAHAQRNVLKITKQRHAEVVIGCSHDALLGVFSAQAALRYGRYA